MTSASHLRKLFEFPAELLQYQKEALPARAGSEILLFYLYNSEELVSKSPYKWNALASEIASLVVPEPDTGENLLPPGICAALSQRCQTAEPEETLFQRVLALMPCLNRFQTRRLIADFLGDPGVFLETIDLSGLVDRLLRRAAELPGNLVAELKLLREVRE